MTIKRKLADACRTLLLAASVTALSVAMAHPQDLQGLNEDILQNPGDSELSLRYARTAEEMGQWRLALAAYERVLINDPENREARRGYERMRRRIEPAFTTVRAEFGVRWDSNALNVPAFEEEDYSLFANATLIDERPLFGERRWRSIVDFEGEVQQDFEQLNYGWLGAQTGPLIYVGPHLAAIPSVGVGVATLDDDFYFSEVNLGVTVEGHRNGLSYWTRLRGGWRDYTDDGIAEDGTYAELVGGLSIPRIISESDVLVLVPWVRLSDIEGSTFNFLTGGDITPGEYVEYGIEATYKYQVGDHLLLAVGATARERRYEQTISFLGPEREDSYFAPEASATLLNVLPCECGVKLAYQHRDNSSNDPTADFDADRVSLSLLTRF